MRIKRVDAVHVSIPLEKPYTLSRGEMHAFDSVITRISTDDGLTGYGEAVPRSVMGNAGAIAELINKHLRSVVMGQSPFDIERLVTDALDVAMRQADRVTAVAAVAGIDLPLWDIVGKQLKQPVYRLMGGLCQEEILVDYTIGAASPAAMASRAKEITGQGFHGVVVKVTCRSVEEDVERVRSVRAALPRGCSVRVDCNGGYSRDEAVAFLEGVRQLGIEFVEQPVAGDAIEGMIFCRGKGVAISADESLVTADDAVTLICRRACDYLNVKIPKVGGLLLAKRIAAIAAAARFPVVVGGRPMLELSRCASRHFAASTSVAAGIAHEGPGPASQMLCDDVVQERSTLRSVKDGDGYIRVSNTPGLGREVIWDKVREYAVSE